MPKVFICYRREDSAYPPHHIYAVLKNHYGSDSVVFDVEYETHVRPRIRSIRANFPVASTLPDLKKTLIEITTTRFLTGVVSIE